MAHVRATRAASTSTSTGTGSFALGPAVAAHRSIQSISGLAVNDTFPYVIVGIDQNGVETGEWEAGTGTYSAANTLSRTTVVASSNSGATVSFSAGNKRVYLSLIAEELLPTPAQMGIPFAIEAPADGDYILAINMPHAGTITLTTTRCTSGTCTATFKVNTTAVGGAANAVSSTEQSVARSTANTFALGDDIVVTISANASATKVVGMIRYTARQG